ncbi:uncharacterized protein B0I36DRAFT_335134 [Microdochium trichocladiopsis]|uniref:Uncharacterized protein n=1 Tax=Microdochium trichocladiopsis TaxID=1682393 RepID=A0A9P8XTT4_9PEZI|nr:uncharacterized protein B0I36DRAFT_335134 [Microdochium trichocladiopsis]KAH7017994.1 hypothetical protein B0I36DRAFT_335134 [Microdochium trichocladiopsis]
MATITKLPDELLLQIFLYFRPLPGRHDWYGSQVEYDEDISQYLELKQLCKVSQAFRRIALPLMYRGLYADAFKADGVNCIIHTLRRRPELCTIIRDVQYWSCVQSVRDVRKAYYRQCFTHEWYSPEFFRFIEELMMDKQYLQSHLDGLVLAFIILVARDVETLDFVLPSRETRTVLPLIFTACAKAIMASKEGKIWVHKGLQPEARHGGAPLMDAADQPPFLADDEGVCTDLVPLSTLRAIKLNIGTWDEVRFQYLMFLDDSSIPSMLFFPDLERFSTRGLFWGTKAEYASLGKPRDALLPDAHDDGSGEHHHYDRAENNRLPFPPYGSRPRMKHLELRSTDIHPSRGLVDILRTFDSLETLAIHFLDDERRCRHNFNPYGPILRQFGRHLSRLELEQSYDRDRRLEEEDFGTLGSLRGSMEDLVQLRLPLHRLIGRIDAGPAPDAHGSGSLDASGDWKTAPDVTRLLPPSLRWFWTSMAIGRDRRPHDKAIERLLNTAEQQLPALEWLLVRTPYKYEIQASSEDFFKLVLGPKHTLYIRKHRTSEAGRCLLPCKKIRVRPEMSDAYESLKDQYHGMVPVPPGWRLPVEPYPPRIVPGTCKIWRRPR